MFRFRCLCSKSLQKWRKMSSAERRIWLSVFSSIYRTSLWRWEEKQEDESLILICRQFLLNIFLYHEFLYFAVDKCLKCHQDADCIQGVCKCKENFVGNGYNCIVELEKSGISLKRMMCITSVMLYVILQRKIIFWY